MPVARRLLIYFSLFANGILFFHKPLFSPAFSFPWDFRGVQLPLISFLAEELSQGRFALWDPFAYCGNPVFANIQASYFHPLVFLAAWVASQTSLDTLPMLLEWVVVLQVCLAALFSFHVFRQFDLTVPAAWAGALIFETGGFFASRAEHIGTLMAVAWMPLAWLAILKLRWTFSARWLGILAIAFGMAVLGGLPQATLAVFLSALVLVIFLVLLRFARPPVIARALLGMFLGIGSSAVIFIPTIQLTQYSVAKYRAGWLGTGGGLYWQSFVSLILPGSFHIFDLSKFTGPWDPSFLYLYGSFAGFLLVLYALLLVRDREVALFGLTALFGAVFMLGDKTLIWRALYPLLPETIRIGIHPEYTYCIFTFAMAGLAAIGLHNLRISNNARWFVGFLIAADLFLVGSNRPMNCAEVVKDPALTRNSFEGSAAVLTRMRSMANTQFPPARIDTLEGASINWTQGATLTRVETASGASPLAPENVIQLRLLLHKGDRWGWYYPVVHSGSPILDVMNVKYLVLPAVSSAQLNANPRFKPVASFPGAEVFENRAVLPRCFTVRNLRRIASPEEGRHLIETGAVDLKETALVYDAIDLAQLGPAQVRITAYKPDYVEITADAPSTGFAVLADTAYPGWIATLDGVPVPIHETDIAFRGIVIPAGKHVIRMRFRPTILYLSGAISLTFLSGIAMLLVNPKARLASLRKKLIGQSRLVS